MRIGKLQYSLPGGFCVSLVPTANEIGSHLLITHVGIAPKHSQLVKAPFGDGVHRASENGGSSKSELREG